MSIYWLFVKFAPFLFPIALGYAMARWVGLSVDGLASLARNVFLPVILFAGISERLNAKLFFMIALAGALVAAGGYLMYRYGNNILKAQMSPAVSSPNVGYFTYPFFFLVMGGAGLGTASAFFVGAAVTSFVLAQLKGGNFQALFKEPWFYAVLLGLAFMFYGSTPRLLGKTISPLVEASYPVLLLFLGAYLHPFKGFKSAEVYVTVVCRFLCGFLVALLAIKLLGLSMAISKGIMLAALAPPVALSLVTNTSSSDTDESATKVGILLGIVLMALILYGGLEPWRLAR